MHSLRVHKYDLGLLARIVVISVYMVFNTYFIFSDNGYLETQNPYIGLIELLVYYLVFLVVRSNHYLETDRTVLLDTASLFSISVFIIGIAEITTSGLGSFFRLTSVFKSPNQLGIYASIILMVRLVFSKHTNLPRWINGLIITVNIVMLLLSQSRAAWIGVLVLMLFIIRDMNIQKKWKYMSLILGGGYSQVYSLETSLFRYFRAESLAHSQAQMLRLTID